jgi:hypothetical protein
MLPKFRSFVRPIIRSFVRSFIVPIHRSSSVHTNYSPSPFNITIHRYYSSTLFTIITIHCYYSPTLFIFITIHHCYYSSIISILIFPDVTIHRYYSSLLFIDHPLTTNFNYSSIMLSSPPKTSQTHIPVIRTPVTVIFLPVGNFPSGHPSQVSPSWARLTLRFLRTRLPNSDSNNSCF